MLSIQSVRKKFKIKIFIKNKKKIKKIIITTTNNIISRARETNVKRTFLTRKNIIIIKRRLNFVIFKIRIKKSKKILKKNDF